MSKLLLALVLAALMLSLSITVHADSIGDILSPGKVIEGHAKVESDCNKCHKKFDKAAQNKLCKDCHKDIAKDIAEMRGYHGRLKEQKDCKVCHTDHKGREANIVQFSPAQFDHSQTNFQLKGGHLDDKVKCKDCHVPNKKFRDAPSSCNACHKKDDQHKGRLGTDCAKCHVEKDWKTTSFDHDKTDFKLLGKHSEVKCKECHIDNKYKDTPKLCNSCHKKDDKHKGNFGPKCETCHLEKSWKEITFNHTRQTKYPLLYKHNELKCTACHKGDIHKEKLQTNCNACHKKDDKHKGTLGPKCESCHLEKGWKEILFDHAKKTKYPLKGKHLTASCKSCHKVDFKEKLPMDCNSCHKKEDKHKGSFGTKCESCHVERDWKEILFDHTKSTKYPLLYRHKDAKCTSCHKGDIYKDKLDIKCYSCHEKDDKHKGQEGKKCETCHNEQDWKKAKFDHAKATFPLLGKHFLVDCKKCHLTPAFKDAKSDCMSCHEKDDVHKKRLGTACETCHNMRNWKAWDFDHNKTNFKLDGPHAKLGCYQCHKQPVNKKLSVSITCGSCHSSDDVHNGEYGRLCERCHIGSTWKKVKIDGKFIRR
ncbi:MAG: cytochrome C [Gallionellaceae bacterium]|jgi:hypothetical protein